MITPASFRLDNVEILRGVRLRQPLLDLIFDYKELGTNLARGSEQIKQTLLGILPTNKLVIATTMWHEGQDSKPGAAQILLKKTNENKLLESDDEGKTWRNICLGDEDSMLRVGSDCRLLLEHV